MLRITAEYGIKFKCTKTEKSPMVRCSYRIYVKEITRSSSIMMMFEVEWGERTYLADSVQKGRCLLSECGSRAVCNVYRRISSDVRNAKDKWRANIVRSEKKVTDGDREVNEGEVGKRMKKKYEEGKKCVHRKKKRNKTYKGNYEDNRKVQFCTLLQVPIRLYGDSRNLNSFTASLHLHKATQCPCTVTKSAVLHTVTGCTVTAGT
jgi:hypothetical protein